MAILLTPFHHSFDYPFAALLDVDAGAGCTADTTALKVECACWRLKRNRVLRFQASFFFCP